MFKIEYPKNRLKNIFSTGAKTLAEKQVKFYMFMKCYKIA